MPSATKALTVRLPSGLYQAGADAARRRNVSLNALIRDGLTALLKEEEYARLYDAFGELGEDAEGSDVEFAIAAQREVVNGGRS